MSKTLIAADKKILGGTPCIAGTRLSVYAIAARLIGGETADDVIADYPGLSVDEITAAADYAARVPFREDAAGKPWRASRSKT